MGKSSCNKIRHIVRLRQMLRRWRLRATSRTPPSNVPAGHVAVCVGSTSRRFVVRTAHLNHPAFRKLLSQAEEEYGFSSQPGPLSLPCDEYLFEHLLRHIATSSSSSFLKFANLDDLQKSLSSCCCCCSTSHGIVRNTWQCSDSLPLLHSGGAAFEKSVW